MPKTFSDLEKSLQDLENAVGALTGEDEGQLFIVCGKDCRATDHEHEEWDAERVPHPKDLTITFPDWDSPEWLKRNEAANRKARREAGVAEPSEEWKRTRLAEMRAMTESALEAQEAKRYGLKPPEKIGPPERSYEERKAAGHLTYAEADAEEYAKLEEVCAPYPLEPIELRSDALPNSCRTSAKRSRKRMEADWEPDVDISHARAITEDIVRKMNRGG